MLLQLNHDVLRLSFGSDEYDIGDSDIDENSDDTNEDIDDLDPENFDELLAGDEREMMISEDGFGLNAITNLPDIARGVVIFSHASGSDRHQPRNLMIARAFNQAGYATILADLLTEEEAHERTNVFDIDLLASRVTLLARWVAAHPKLRNLPVALYGAGTGSAAALKAAAQLGDRVQAVISRGGRPDLASDILAEVHSPTLLIVGSEDTPAVEMNHWACRQLKITCETKVIEGADHLFEEQGALSQVIALSKKWLDRFLMTHPAWKSTYTRMQQQYII